MARTGGLDLVDKHMGKRSVIGSAPCGHIQEDMGGWCTAMMSAEPNRCDLISWFANVKRT